MPAEVVRFPGITCLDLPPDRLLEEALGKLESVVILGETKDGEEYFAFSLGSAPEILWLMERAKHSLMTFADES